MSCEPLQRSVYRVDGGRHAWIGGTLTLALSLAFCMRVMFFELERNAAEAVHRCAGSQPPWAFLRWQQLVQEGQHLSDPQKIEQVNKFWNSWRHAGNPSAPDGPPAEPRTSPGGTRLDDLDRLLAVSKYATLRVLYVPDDQLRITYVLVRNQSSTSARAVVSYYGVSASDPLILDTSTDLVRPASSRKDLTPVFSAPGIRVMAAVLREIGPAVPAQPCRAGP